MFNELIDVKENHIMNVDYELLSILLYDHSSKQNIIWATNNYSSKGEGYQYYDHISIEKITGENGNIIQPRIKKSREEKIDRVKNKGEVFTPSWMCNLQINVIDKEWFNGKNVFNEEINNGWNTKEKRIDFKKIGKSWEDYVLSNRLEIACGEAPYIASRYDTVSGRIINIKDRIGFLDRKFRVINENCSDKEWIEWSLNAIKSVYGYDWQGDNVLLARENVLFSYIDYYKNRFATNPSIDLIRKVAYIISWNIWQMDGIKFVIPDSCVNREYIDSTIFGENMMIEKCYGCENQSIYNHNGIYCKIMNWKTNRQKRFALLVKGVKRK